MKIRRTKVAATLALLLASAACSSAGRPVVSRASGQGEGEGVMVEVENQNFKDATVYAVWSTTRDRLGLVVGNTTQTFTVPWKASELRIEVDFIAGDDIVTEAMGVSRGDNLKVVIPPNR